MAVLTGSSSPPQPSCQASTSGAPGAIPPPSRHQKPPLFNDLRISLEPLTLSVIAAYRRALHELRFHGVWVWVVPTRFCLCIRVKRSVKDTILHLCFCFWPPVFSILVMSDDYQSTKTKQKSSSWTELTRKHPHSDKHEVVTGDDVCFSNYSALKAERWSRHSCTERSTSFVYGFIASSLLSTP